MHRRTRRRLSPWLPPAIMEAAHRLYLCWGNNSAFNHLAETWACALQDRALAGLEENPAREFVRWAGQDLALRNPVLLKTPEFCLQFTFLLASAEQMRHGR